MTVRIYKDSAGDYRLNDDVISIGKYRLIYDASKTLASIRDISDYFAIVDLQLITDYQDESGTPYADAAALEAALEGLITASIYDLLSDPNFALKVQFGQVRGVYAVNKFGENPEITTQTDPEDIWDFGGVYNFSTSAIIDSISSTSVGDTVEITIEGLDANWDVVLQTINLTGQTRVAIPTPMIRVYRAFNSNGTDLLGNVYVYENTAISVGVPVDTTKIRAEIKALSNQTEMMIYSVPAGKTAAYLEGFIAISRGGGASASADMTFKTRLFGKVFRVKRRIALNSQGSSNWRAVYSIPQILPEKSDILFRVELVSATVGVAGGFQALVFDNVIWGL